MSSCHNGKKEVNIIFDSKGGSTVPSITNIDDFDVNNLPVPTKEGNTFIGWYLDEEFDVNIIGNVPEKLEITLYAKWKVNSYIITYHTNGGTPINKSTHLFGSEINAPLPPTKEGHSFEGWFEDSALKNEFTFQTMPSRDLNLYAKWIPNTYKITFDSKGGSEVEDIVAEYNAEIKAPPIPQFQGHRFLGWFLDEDYKQEFIFSKMPLNGAHLYAKWELESLSITFVTGLDLTVDPIYAYEDDL